MSLEELQKRKEQKGDHRGSPIKIAKIKNTEMLHDGNGAGEAGV